MTSHESKTIAVANRFVASLREVVGAENFAEVRRRNRADADLAVCHSHDFCDANELMHAAVVGVVGSKMSACGYRLYDVDEHDALWCDAWSLARRLHLS